MSSVMWCNPQVKSNKTFSMYIFHVHFPCSMSVKHYFPNRVFISFILKKKKHKNKNVTTTIIKVS